MGIFSKKSKISKGLSKDIKKLIVVYKKVDNKKRLTTKELNTAIQLLQRKRLKLVQSGLRGNVMFALTNQSFGMRRFFKSIK